MSSSFLKLSTEKDNTNKLLIDELKQNEFNKSNYNKVMNQFKNNENKCIIELEKTNKELKLMLEKSIKDKEL